MAGKTSKASTPRPRKAGLKAGHEAFAQAYASNGGNAADAYRKAYPRCKSAHAAETNGSLLLRNTEVAARISEILRRGAERAGITVEQVLRELAKIGFSDIRKAVNWRVNPANAPNTEVTLRDVEAAARAIGLQIQVLNASTAREMDSAFASLMGNRASPCIHAAVACVFYSAAVKCAGTRKGELLEFRRQTIEFVGNGIRNCHRSPRCVPRRSRFRSSPFGRLPANWHRLPRYRR